MILLIDNYDSFAHNLARYLELLGQTTLVVRNDDTQLDTFDWNSIDALVISPGPCAPAQAGKTLAVLDSAMQRTPVLGVCLGHQAIVEASGGKIIASGKPVHGRTSRVAHDGKHEFDGLPNPFSVARYHSLIAEPTSLPAELTVSATTEDGTIMAVRHNELPIVGWQFHPESILTNHGFALLAGFLIMANINVDRIPDFDRELSTPSTDTGDEWPSGVTF